MSEVEKTLSYIAIVEEIKILTDTIAKNFNNLSARVDTLESKIMNISKMPGPMGPKGDKGDRGEKGEYGEVIIGPPGPAGSMGLSGKDAEIDEEKLKAMIKKIVKEVMPKGEIRLGGHGGGINIDTPVEAVGADRTSFTFFWEPKYIIADNAIYFENLGYTRSGNIYTLGFTPQNYVRAVR